MDKDIPSSVIPLIPPTLLRAIEDIGNLARVVAMVLEEDHEYKKRKIEKKEAKAKKRKFSVSSDDSIAGLIV